jgi:signal transduction histidine kinase
MKTNILRVFSLFLLMSAFLFAQTTEKDVISLVKQGVAVIEKNGVAGIKAIGKKNGDFVKGTLYAFAYDTNVVMVAHPIKPHLVGRSYKGKPDVKGKKFRDEIVSKALNGGGWTTYVYQKPKTKGLFNKKAYSLLAVTKDGKKYIVAAGMYSK